MHVNAGGTHPLEERIGNVPASHVVINQAHLNSSPRLVHKRVGNEAAKGVVAYYVCLKMDVMPCLPYVVQQGEKERIAVRENVRLVVLEWQRPVKTCKQLNQHVVFFGQLEVLLFCELKHRALCQLVHALPADVLFLARVLSEKEVKHDAHYGDEYKHHHPSHRFGRLAVVHEHFDHCEKHNTDVYYEYQPMKVNHLFSI